MELGQDVAAANAGKGKGQETASLARMEAVEAQHRAAWQQIQDEHADTVLIAQLKEDAVLVTQNHAILDSVTAARAADGGEDGEDEATATRRRARTTTTRRARTVTAGVVEDYKIKPNSRTGSHK